MSHGLGILVLFTLKWKLEWCSWKKVEFIISWYIYITIFQNTTEKIIIFRKHNSSSLVPQPPSDFSPNQPPMVTMATRQQQQPQQQILVAMATYLLIVYGKQRRFSPSDQWRTLKRSGMSVLANHGRPARSPRWGRLSTNQSIRWVMNIQ